MKIILATGIYPPLIGGPATYAKALADECANAGHEVVVVTYGEAERGEKWAVENVPLGFPILRWFSYAKKLKHVGADADVVYALSSISCGVPLILSGLKSPKRVLRLGGDFLWERYTDWGGRKSLRAFYQSFVLGKWVMQWILNRFDHIVFSTQFQQEIYQKSYRNLSKHSVIENALHIESVAPAPHQKLHSPMRLLFMGRTVKFKNISALIEAVAQIPDVVLTIVGQGPQDHSLRKTVERLGVWERVRFVAPVSGMQKIDLFASHDVLVIPSLTDISPNTALEARAYGLPVLLTKETGLSAKLLDGMIVKTLLQPSDIVAALFTVRENYATLCESTQRSRHRSWNAVFAEHEALFASL